MLVFLCGTFIAAVAATTYGLIAEKQIAIEFARNNWRAAGMWSPSKTSTRRRLAGHRFSRSYRQAGRKRVLMVGSRINGPETVEATIQDSGVGITPTDAERIFEAFYTTESEGIGMGLFICRSIIEPHGGRLRASPRTPHGSIFHVTLPSADR